MAVSAGCVAPMVFLDCSNASVDAQGAECVRSCHTLDVDCVSRPEGQGCAARGLGGQHPHLSVSLSRGQRNC